MEQFERNLKGECRVKKSALKVSDSTYWAQGLFGVFSKIFWKIRNLLKEQNQGGEQLRAGRQAGRGYGQKG